MIGPRAAKNTTAAGLTGSAVVVSCALVAAVLMAGGCKDERDRGTRAGAVDDLPRAAASFRSIALDLPVDPERAEFSGLDWWGDRLVILPQYPSAFGSDSTAAVLTIDRARLAAYVGGRDTTAIRPVPLAFEDFDLASDVEGWDGYEAIAFDGDDVYLTVECLGPGGWEGVVLRGRIEGTPPRIVVDARRRLHLPTASGRANFSEEALFVFEDAVWSLHELNGRRVNESPVATRFDRDLARLESWPMDRLEYRVTDATRVAPDGRFFVFNQFWPGEAAAVDAATDDLEGRDRPPGRPVERIVGMRVLDGRVRVDREVGLLALTPRADDVARNWEGLARFGDDGFFIVTDRHPRTLFGYVERR